jgi:hypothetical protein
MRQLFTGTCLAAVCAVGLAAQPPTSQPPASSPTPDPKTVTATGCPRAGDDATTFVLANVKWDDKAKSGAGATGTSGTGASAAASSAANSTIRLVGAPAGVKLTEHIGQTVEVTGTIGDKEKAPSATSGTAGAGTGGDQTSRTRAQSDKPEQTLNVRTVKMVSSSCDSR